MVSDYNFSIENLLKELNSECISTWGGTGVRRQEQQLINAYFVVSWRHFPWNQGRSLFWCSPAFSGSSRWEKWRQRQRWAIQIHFPQWPQRWGKQNLIHKIIDVVLNDDDYDDNDDHDILLNCLVWKITVNIKLFFCARMEYL